MSETTTTYDTGEVQVRVGGDNRVSARATAALETAWAIEAGCGAWGEMTATFERGELVLLRTQKTAKP